jgi:quercetin dioxygenase-like cupin family protein
VTKVGKVVRGRHFRWEGIPTRPYKDESDAFVGVERHVLLGEQSDETALSFVTRYFELAVGGFSTLEQHGHPHAVVVLRGRGTVRLGDEVFDLQPHDVVYVPPNAPHQFRADYDEPLGLLCIVDRKRDRPRAIREARDR